MKLPFLPVSAAFAGVLFLTSLPAAPATGAVERSVRRGTLTTPEGQPAVASVFRQWDPQSGTGTLNEAAITPDGRLFARAGNLTRRSDGTLADEGSCTDFDGATYNYAGTIRRTARGVEESGRMVGAGDGTLTYVATSAPAPGGGIVRTLVITRPDGTRETLREELAAERPAAGRGRHAAGGLQFKSK